MTPRTLLVTIDTEVDKDPHWRIASPVSFRSVVEGVPGCLSPLFDRHGVVPTYFLSPEVLEEPACVATLKALGARAELGTHLHSEFVEPQRRLSRATMAGQPADALQRQYPREIEAAKLRSLTDLFRAQFGYAPTSFRAGRYGMSDATLELLAELGYLVDSSVTPGLRWRYDEGTLDYRDWEPVPKRVSTAAGELVELPLSIRCGGPLARLVRDWPERLQRPLRGLFGARAAYDWLRPSWQSGDQLIAYVNASPEPVLNLMFHSMEIIPGASPYARTTDDVDRIVGAMDRLFAYCARAGYRFCGITDAARMV